MKKAQRTESTDRTTERYLLVYHPESIFHPYAPIPYVVTPIATHHTSPMQQLEFPSSNKELWMKHIKVQYNCVQETILSEKIIIKYTPTKDGETCSLGHFQKKTSLPSTQVH